MSIFYPAVCLLSILVIQQSLSLPVQDVSDPSLPFQLAVEPALVNRYTASTVTLRCARNLDVPTKLVEILRLRIAKQFNSAWNLVAEQQDGVGSPTVSGNATVSANIKGDRSRAFLQVSWQSVGPESFGVFKCYAVGLDKRAELVTEKSSPLEVYRFKKFIHQLIKISVDTREKVEELKNFTGTEIKRLDNGLERLAQSVAANQSAIEGSIQALDTQQNNLETQQINLETKQNNLETQQNNLETQQNNLETQQNKLETQQNNLEMGQNNLEERFRDNENTTDTEILQLMKELSADHKAMAAYRKNQSSLENKMKKIESMLFKSSQWPQGYYALLQPKTGCPVDSAFLGGYNTYMKIHTQSQSSSDPADAHTSAFRRDTKSSVGSKRFVTLEFCEVSKQLHTAEWPQGSFCINKFVDRSCPTHFDSGRVRFDTEDTDHSSEARNNVGDNDELYFCCQNTTSASVPIELPTDSPFVLYRRGGVCQAVEGMSVSKEYIQINTEDSNNKDKFDGSLPDIDNPGSSVIKFNLCYYTKL